MPLAMMPENVPFPLLLPTLRVRVELAVCIMQTASSTRTLSVGNNNGNGTFSGIIANGINDTLSFTKAGSGTQTLTGATNTYTGRTTVTAAILSFANASLG